MKIFIQGGHLSSQKQVMKITDIGMCRIKTEYQGADGGMNAHREQNIDTTSNIQRLADIGPIVGDDGPMPGWYQMFARNEKRKKPC